MRRAPGPAAHPLDSLDARLHSGKHHPHIRSQGWPLATKLSWENICGPNIRLRALQMIGVADELEVASEILHLLTGPIVPKDKAGQVGANLVLLGGEHHELSVGQPAAFDLRKLAQGGAPVVHITDARRELLGVLSTRWKNRLVSGANCSCRRRRPRGSRRGGDHHGVVPLGVGSLPLGGIAHALDIKRPKAGLNDLQQLLSTTLGLDLAKQLTGIQLRQDSARRRETLTFGMSLRL